MLMGCLEVRCSSDLAIPLFLVSSYVTTDFVSTLIFPLGNAIVTAETLGIWAVQVKSSLPPKDARGQQHVWNRALIEKKWDNLSKLPLLWLRLISSQPSDDPNPSCIGFDNHPRTLSVSSVTIVMTPSFSVRCSSSSTGEWPPTLGMRERIAGCPPWVGRLFRFLVWGDSVGLMIAVLVDSDMVVTSATVSIKNSVFSCKVTVQGFSFSWVPPYPRKASGLSLHEQVYLTCMRGWAADRSKMSTFGTLMT